MKGRARRLFEVSANTSHTPEACISLTHKQSAGKHSEEDVAIDNHGRSEEGGGGSSAFISRTDIKTKKTLWSSYDEYLINE